MIASDREIGRTRRIEGRFRSMYVRGDRIMSSGCKLTVNRELRELRGVQKDVRLTHDFQVLSFGIELPRSRVGVVSHVSFEAFASG